MDLLEWKRNMETPSAHITLETKLAKFNEQEHSSFNKWVQKCVLSAEIPCLAGNCCCTGRWFECQAVQLVAGMEGTSASMSSSFTLGSGVDTEHRQKKAGTESW